MIFDFLFFIFFWNPCFTTGMLPSEQRRALELTRCNLIEIKRQDERKLFVEEYHAR